jgi:hypothetical protein
VEPAIAGKGCYGDRQCRDQVSGYGFGGGGHEAIV